jgi:hypothetical protein
MEMHGYKDVETKEEKAERKAKMATMKQDFMEFKKSLEPLIEKYNSAADKDKAGIKKELRALVAAQTDKDIAARKEMLQDQKARITKLEEFIADIEANKEKRIDERVDFMTSPEGYAKMKEHKEKREKIEQSPNENSDSGMKKHKNKT